MTLPAQNGACLQSAYYRELERELDSCWLLDAIIQGEGGMTGSANLCRLRTEPHAASCHSSAWDGGRL